MGTRQQNLFPFQSYVQVTPLIGWFFEILASKLLISKLNGNRKSRKENSNFDPDLRSRFDNDLYLEVKSSQIGREFKIQEKQFKQFIQCRDCGFPYSKLYYVFFEYSIKNVVKECPTDKELFTRLQKSIERCLVLDSIILEKILPNTIRKYNNWIPFYKFEKHHFDEFENSLEEKLTDLGLSTENFLVEKKTIPPTKIIRFQTNSFRFLSVTKR